MAVTIRTRKQALSSIAAAVSEWLAAKDAAELADLVGVGGIPLTPAERERLNEGSLEIQLRLSKLI